MHVLTAVATSRLHEDKPRAYGRSLEAGNTLESEPKSSRRQSAIAAVVRMASFYLLGLYVIQWLLLVPLTECRNVVVRKEGDAHRRMQLIKSQS